MSDVVNIRDAQREVHRALNELADEIDDHQKKLDASKLSFASTGAAAGIMTIVGLALTPVTFGASLGLVIAGGVVGGLSAAGSIGSIIADKVLTSKTMKKAQEKLLVLAVEVESVQAQLPRLIARLNGEDIDILVNRIRGNASINEETQNTLFARIKTFARRVHDHASVISPAARVARASTEVIENIISLSVALSKASEAGKVLNGLAAGSGAAANAANAGRAVGQAADVAADTGKAAAKVGLPAAKAAGIALAGVGLVFDLGGIIFYSIKVHKQKPCDVAQNIRRVANCLN